ncbi:helix-turn-helix domain-containing protein [Lapidilactobacillus bayanensis]|uniref:helix-turn-helix domain-containing protein n=1 Tax=Lapidilactobacillus bayanensis TaxID=2485998 RepID=UPI0017818CE8|nr:helix-turn-helix transcriptional regulator [Lapidilactobacillus bayanensis]
MEFATQVKKYREQQHWSQEELADKLFISRQAVSKWENGDGTPDLDKLVALATVLNVSLDTLVLGKETASSTTPHNVDQHDKGSRPMNGWEFLSRYWWVLIALIYALGYLINRFN